MTEISPTGAHEMTPDRTPDLTAACRRTGAVIAAVRPAQLTAATPCEQFQVGDLLHHLGGLALAFAAAAARDFGELTDHGGAADAARLDADWRASYPARLTALAGAWSNPSAWSGETRIAGMDLPGDVVGAIALTEVVVHGWDLARATGQRYAVDERTAIDCLGYLTPFAAQAPVEGLFAAAVPVAPDAPAMDRIVALSGRRPDWAPAG
ncbi:TIGR03086 family metal-binding protein [Mycolicibacterium palauense]|uniref:TIGR03086 family metal-binding protein n=1 Tax=Mycolicibacterium palauense TaxID=2034511 RepID=UPI001FE5DB16|nr:TIGR03086 family metal-binding protein [Mycolicibacterium palauense]